MKLIGEGTLLQIESAATPGTYETITQRLSITGPSRSIDSVDETDLDSPAVERRPDTIPDMGDVSLEMFFDPETTNAIHARLETLTETPANVNWRLVFNNRTNARPHRQFNGHITAFDNTGMEKGSDLMGSITIAINGPITKGTTNLGS